LWQSSRITLAAITPPYWKDHLPTGLAVVVCFVKKNR
jgi:hypothetical protein